ncbi:D-amino peptidase [Amycolatopsis rubida]|uniref:D-amino peptidase n=1 Tax=Amycolatopsis rubida TaxID=112413 RepID=A0A1I5MSP3_9PSEU|nr:D-amino peptidase [Amycolatopsis rubida]
MQWSFFGQLGLNAALAAHYGIPPALPSGDDTVAAEAAEVAPGIRSAVVKRALGARAAAARSACEMPHPDEACDQIERAVHEALASREDVRPLRFDGPVGLEVQVHRPRMPEHALLVPGMELADGCTLRYQAPDFPTAYQVIELIATLRAI